MELLARLIDDIDDLVALVVCAASPGFVGFVVACVALTTLSVFVAGPRALVLAPLACGGLAALLPARKRAGD